MNIYRNTNKPTEGWIHGCFNCGANTAYTQNYKYDNKTHVVFLCRNCKKTTRNEATEQKFTTNFESKIKNYINDRTLVPYKARVFSLEPPVINYKYNKPTQRSLPIEIPKKNSSTPLLDDINKKNIFCNNEKNKNNETIFQKVNTQIIPQ